MRRQGAGVVVLLAKVGPKFLAVLAKLAKFSKLGLGAASLAAYSYLHSWQFAVMLMITIGLHEGGHLWAMKRSGMKTRGFYFIPLLGGAAIADEAFPSRRVEAFVALAGPFVGWLVCLATAAIYFATGNPLYAAMVAWMALINLLPVNPLDGGRVLKSIVFSASTSFGYTVLCVVLGIAMFCSFKLGLGLVLYLGLIGWLELSDTNRAAIAARQRAALKAELEELLGRLAPIGEGLDLMPKDDTTKAIQTKAAEAYSSLCISSEDRLARVKWEEAQAALKLIKPMAPSEMAWSGAAYVILAVVLVGTMYVFAHEPGAAHALDLIR